MTKWSNTFELNHTVPREVNPNNMEFNQDVSKISHMIVLWRGSIAWLMGKHCGTEQQQ